MRQLAASLGVAIIYIGFLSIIIGFPHGWRRLSQEVRVAWRRLGVGLSLTLSQAGCLMWLEDTEVIEAFSVAAAVFGAVLIVVGVIQLLDNQFFGRGRPRR